MKIDYISDIHLEFFNKRFNKTRFVGCGGPSRFPKWENSESEILILAGDICNIEQFLTGLNFDFFDHIASQYQQIIWVFGNHEYYGTSLCNDTIKEVQDKLQARYGDQFYATNLGVLNYKDIKFICTTLWTDYDRKNPMAMIQAQMGMPDCQMITDKFGDTFTPDAFFTEHMQSIKLLESELSEDLELISSKPIVVVSHHLPSYKSVPDRFTGSSLNPAFASDLDYIFSITENLKVWVHGHTHDACDYTIGNCRILCNPHGYIGYEVSDGDFCIKTFEI